MDRNLPQRERWKAVRFSARSGLPLALPFQLAYVGLLYTALTLRRIRRATAYAAQHADLVDDAPALDATPPA